tara:strand:- start:695 stop:916 length:222 start_codon:yes stop_codon:yes gene_type:complete
MKERGYNSERNEQNYSGQNYLFPELKYELENKDSNGQYTLFSRIPAERKNYEEKNKIKNDSIDDLFYNEPNLF